MGLKQASCVNHGWVLHVQFILATLSWIQPQSMFDQRVHGEFDRVHNDLPADIFQN